MNARLFLIADLPPQDIFVNNTALLPACNKNAAHARPSPQRLDPTQNERNLHLQTRPLPPQSLSVFIPFLFRTVIV